LPPPVSSGLCRSGEQATIARERALAAEGHASRKGSPFSAVQVARMLASVEGERAAA
jgi:hypothetical protein